MLISFLHIKGKLLLSAVNLFTTMTLKKNILLIDDDEELAALLTEHLASENIAVNSCLDGVTGLAKAYDDNIDLIILDVMMPRLGGFEVLKALGGSHKTPILMLTASGNDSDRIQGFELGADDYLAKPFKFRELLARINAIFRRVNIIKNQEGLSTKQAISEESINQVTINHATREIYCHDTLLDLTGNQYLILAYFISKHSQVVNQVEISEQVLQRKLGSFDRTIDAQVSKIRRKLLAINPVDKFKTVRGSGYVFLKGE